MYQSWDQGRDPKTRVDILREMPGLSSVVPEIIQHQNEANKQLNEIKARNLEEFEGIMEALKLLGNLPPSADSGLQFDQGFADSIEQTLLSRAQWGQAIVKSAQFDQMKRQL